MAEENKYAIHAAAREGRGKQDISPLTLSTTNKPIPAAVIESLLNVYRQTHTLLSSYQLTSSQADPKLANRKDQDGRLPIHWAASANNFEVFSLLVNQKGFDPDVQVFPP